MWLAWLLSSHDGDALFHQVEVFHFCHSSFYFFYSHSCCHCQRGIDDTAAALLQKVDVLDVQLQDISNSGLIVCQRGIDDTAAALLQKAAVLDVQLQDISNSGLADPVLQASTQVHQLHRHRRRR